MGVGNISYIETQFVRKIVFSNHFMCICLVCCAVAMSLRRPGHNSYIVHQWSFEEKKYSRTYAADLEFSIYLMSCFFFSRIFYCQSNSPMPIRYGFEPHAANAFGHHHHWCAIRKVPSIPIIIYFPLYKNERRHRRRHKMHKLCTDCMHTNTPHIYKIILCFRNTCISLISCYTNMYTEYERRAQYNVRQASLYCT